ncbi:MAG: DNA primase [Candidatus Solibacter usitatus]|nr:DNA primase [Candidatus Solibacter usitatus]
MDRARRRVGLQPIAIHALLNNNPPMDFAQHLKSQVDIVDVIGERVRLKRAGAGPRFVGLCPFHTEKTGSFSVHSVMQIYKCFGCGAAGDVFKFVMEMDNCTFPEAVKLLAERTGIPMPARSEHSDRESRLREAVLRMNEMALLHFRGVLMGGQGGEARGYVESRGVPMETAEQFGIGMSDRGGPLLDRLRREGFTEEHLEASGLIIRRQDGSGFFERFRGRLMFPIHNESGKVAGFAGRAMAKGDEPKYMNSPETAVYRKSQILYNLHRAKESARKAGRFILVEGYMDVIGLSAAGIAETVASCGTALTNGQVKLMRRFADQVTVNFDPDTGGARGAEKSIQVLLDEHARVRVLELDQDLDPDEYIKQHGAETYLKLLDRAPNYYLWLADQSRRKFDTTSTEGRMDAMRFLMPSIQRIPDKIERAAVAGDLASYLGVERGLILEQFKRAAIDRREQSPRQSSQPLSGAERILLNAVMQHPSLRAEIVPQLAVSVAAQQFRTRRIFEIIFQLYDQQPDFSFGDLEGRLEEADKDLLSRVLFADDIGETNNLEESREWARENALSSLRMLEKAARESTVAGLRQEIRQAEQRGDLAAALTLTQELDRLRKSG